jgi:hypothetical protein
MADPRFITARSLPTYGRRVARLAAALGHPLMPWQRLTADLLGEHTPDGLRAHPFGVVTVQRQAGKTTYVQAAAVERCLLGPPGQRVWYTAQTGAVAREKWAEVATQLCAETSPLAGYVAAGWSRGSEVLTFPNGSTFRPFPPTRDALHSKQSDLVIVDEAWKFDEVRGAELLQAISPTQATRPGAQTVLLSTMGTLTGSTWFHRWVDRGRGGDPAVTYVEYGIGDAGDPEDLAAVCAAHPAVGHTITPAFIAAQLPILGPSEFARAFGNARTATQTAVIPAPAWQAIRHRDVTPRLAVPPVLGVDVATDRSAGAIVACWPDVDGVPTLEVIYHGPVAELAGRVQQIKAGHLVPLIAADSAGPVLTVTDELARLGVSVTALTPREYSAACASLLDKITAGAVQHRGDPALDAAVAAATRRPIGDGGWGWARRSAGADVAALVAGTLAVWAHHRRPVAVRPSVYAG